MDVLVRPPALLFPLSTCMPSEYQTLLTRNNGTPYTKPVVLFLLPAQEDQYITEMMEQLRKSAPPVVEYVFVRIAQNHQIGMVIRNYSPWIVVTPGDGWLRYFIPEVEGLPVQTCKDLHGIWQFVVCESGHRMVVYPLEDLPLRRRRRLSNEKVPPTTLASFTADSPPRRYTLSSGASPTSSPRGSPPTPSSRSSSPFSLVTQDEAPEAWSTVPTDLHRLATALSCMRPPGWPISSAQ